MPPSPSRGQAKDRGWCQGIIACPATAAIAQASKGQVMMLRHHCPPCLLPLLPLQGKLGTRCWSPPQQPRCSSPQQPRRCHCIVTTAATSRVAKPCRPAIDTAAASLPQQLQHCHHVITTAAALLLLRCCHSSRDAAIASLPQQRVAATAAALLPSRFCHSSRNAAVVSSPQ